MIPIKNRTIVSLFSDIGVSTTVIVTIWSSWLEAAIYYTDNFSEVKHIITSLSHEGILITTAIEVVNNIYLISDLVQIKECYEKLICILDKFLNSSYVIYSGHDILTEYFKSDPVNIKSYILVRFYNNDIKTIVKCISNYLLFTTGMSAVINYC